MNGEQILRIFAVRWRWIAACIGLGAVVATILAFTLPQVYDSHSQVIVSVSDDAEVGPAESATYVNDRIPTVLEISGSNDFADAVSDAEGVDRSPTAVQEALNFSLVPDTTVIEISAEDSDPEQAARLSNAAAEVMTRPVLTEQLGNDEAIEVAVLQKADTNGGAVFPDQPRFIGIGALAGLALGLVVAPIRHRRDPKVRDLTELSRILDSRLLAVRNSKPTRAIRQQITTTGAAMTIAGLLARLGLISHHRETLYLALCGVEGAGNELAADIIETAAANSMSCLLVSAEPAALRTAHYRELSTVRGIDIVDSNARSGSGIVSGAELAEILPKAIDDYDLVVFLGSDLVAHPDACAYLCDAELAVVVTVPTPDRSDLQATSELIRANGTEITGYVLVDPTAALHPAAPLSAGGGSPAVVRHRSGADRMDDVATSTRYMVDAEPAHGTAEAAEVSGRSIDSKNSIGGQP